jgi:hypothetical protein
VELDAVGAGPVTIGEIGHQCFPPETASPIAGQ